MFQLRGPLCLIAILSALLLLTSARAQDPDRRIEQLEKRLSEVETKLDVALEELAARRGVGAAGAGESSPLRAGGYGEMHATFTQGGQSDYLDNHRFVLYLGYQFEDWIQLHSETELEHSFVADGDGEVSLEQLYTDFSLCDAVGVRIGRYLVPVGIVNARHEPPTFHGVERPSVETVLIPTTWSQDGLGVYGEIGDHLRYQAYVGSSLDGSQFHATDGIRGGRLKERPGITEPGFTGRLDYDVLDDVAGHRLRFGASFFAGGLDNANKGRSMSPGFLELYAADLEYGWRGFEFRSVYAVEHVRDADSLNAAFGNNVARRMQGYYVEGAYRFLPDSWKEGKLADADAAVFVRWEDYDTQDAMPAGATADPAGDRTEIQFGISFFPTSQVVLKADYRVRDDKTPDGLDDLLNFGLGFRF